MRQDSGINLTKVASLTSECWHLEIVHLGESDKEGELILLNCQLEESPASNDLEAGQDDPPDIHVRDEDISRDLADMLKKTEIKVLVLKHKIVEIFPTKNIL